MLTESHTYFSYSGYFVSSPLTGPFLCGIPLDCTNYPIDEIWTEIFSPIEKDLEKYQCFSPFPLLYTIHIPTYNPSYVHIIEDSNNWIYADYLDVGNYSVNVSVCLYAGIKYYCFGSSIDLGSVRLVVEPNSKRLFPYGNNYYLDSRAEDVDDIALAVRVSNSLPFFDKYYNELYVSTTSINVICINVLYQLTSGQ